ncbi:probable multidrug resistance-associated protein lethal(2)03659 isoform X2 [Periplaneta americana]
MEVLLRVSQPLFLGRLVRYFSGSNTDSNISKEAAYLSAAGIVLCSGLNIFVIHPYMMAIFHMGMKIRVACCSLIYRKALRLSMTALGDTTTGQVVNLMSNDVNRFDVALVFLHYLWVGPIETCVVTYFMWNEVGVSAVIGVASLLLFIPLQGFLGKKSSEYRLKTAIRTDERVRLMNEIILGIQVIKMYTWEIPFAKLVNSARKFEICAIKYSSYMRGILLSFIMFTTRISLFISVLSYVLLGNYITAEKVFVLVSYYQILRQTMTVFFPQGISQIAEAYVSVNRLQKFMLYEERDLKSLAVADTKNDAVMPPLEHGEVNHVANNSKKENMELGVRLSDATAQWTPELHDKTLNKVTLHIKPGTLVAVIGPVGAGKTSFLLSILKELPLMEGTIEVGGTVSYASQEPWLFAGSVRQNILFGQPLVRERYNHVIKVCALKRDFQLLPYGDKTIVGERGISLSGGQRARINLARAVYKDADLYLLDDPLSAVDPHVGKHLFDDCIAGFLKEKTVILATHQLHHLKQVDQIIIFNNGSVAVQGTYNELQASGLDFAKLLSSEPDDDSLEDDPPLQKMLRQMSIASVSSTDEKQPEPKEVAEMRTVGSVSAKVYNTYLRAGGNYCVLLTLILLFVLSQVLASGCDYWITYWTNIEERRWKLEHFTDTLHLIENGHSINESLTEDTNNSFVNSSFVSNSVNNTSMNVSSFKTNTTTVNTKERDSELSSLLDTDMCIYIFTCVTLGTVVVTLLRSFTFFKVCMRASVQLHDAMFRSITRGTMYFFNTNSSGRILNRFSKDTGAIDEMLPAAMIDCLQIGLTMCGIIIVVAVVNFWLLIPTFFVGVTFYLLRNVYLSTSRSVKRLEGLTRSPVFQHLNASLQGLTTIRAFRAQAILEKEFDSHQDLHSGAWYLFIASSRAFGFWLDIVCLIYITIVTISFLLIGGDSTGGNVGLAITQAIGLTGMLQWGMRQSTELENQMTSVERVVEFTQIEHEPPLTSPPDKKPPKSWPSEGAIKFDRLFLIYSKADGPVLKNLNFSIEAKEKVGIVGRTGAGKSSLIAALFRLAPLEGSIYIDGIDTTAIGLHELRSKLSIIPQEPVLFSGTLRKNLDPFDEYSDSILWRALEEVELKEVINDMSAGLNSRVMEGGSNFSVGQRQLVCLARAIIRNNTILVLDEATANVDPQTDTLIQMTIRKKFVNCTVLTIAHRLHTVMDSDKVLVMDAGTMVEFDHPHLLLQNKDGFLYNMVQQTGKAMIETLTNKAKKSFDDLEQKQSSSVSSNKKA